MEGGLPMLDCLLQNTLRSLCVSSDSSNSSKWVYSVFWKILPRNYPPPRWDYGGGALDRSKGNKRNWILVWEDGFCDFYECERAGSGYVKGKFGPEIFFKMAHEVYNYGEGLVGKVAVDNSHKWVFKEAATENEPNFFSSWNGLLDPQPKAWDYQFNSGIQTIAIIAVREGIIQLGSFDKVIEDLNFVISIQRKFNYLQSIPGVFAMQRPYRPPFEFPNTLKPDNQMTESDNADNSDNKRCTQIGAKRHCNDKLEESLSKSTNLGWNSPHNRVMRSMPPYFPSMSYSLGALLSKLPCVVPSDTQIETLNLSLNYNNADGSKVIGSLGQIPELKAGATLGESRLTANHVSAIDAPESKPKTLNPSHSWEGQAVEFGVSNGGGE